MDLRSMGSAARALNDPDGDVGQTITARGDVNTGYLLAAADVG